MKSLLLLLLLVALAWPAQAQNYRRVGFEAVEDLMNRQNDTLYVVNFWATWCRPCVAELPGFLKTEKALRDRPLKFVFLSLDFPNKAEENLKPFLAKKNITSTVWLMKDTDYNSWINKVSESWEGDIPATLFFRNSTGFRKFHTGQMAADELEKLLRNRLS